MEGALIVAEPVTLQKEGIKVTEQPWFVNAAEKVANMHFSTPHIQNLFRDDAKRYYRVISLSQEVDFISGDRPENGILLVDMKYSFIEKLFSRINYKSSEHYYYICDGDGKLIYHPYANEISNGMFSENVDIPWRGQRRPHDQRDQHGHHAAGGLQRRHPDAVGHRHGGRACGACRRYGLQHRALRGSGGLYAAGG